MIQCKNCKCKNKKNVKSTTNSTKEKEKEVINNFEDEYYDLEGF